ncbi:MAG: hypothetical protein V7608_5285 [Hyphomicrobiales bacterium]|jgi:hypothetical protein
MIDDDVLQIAALELLVEASAAVEVGLDHPDMTPIKAILALAREEAASALRALIAIDPTQTAEIRRLQNEARRYDSLVAWLRKIVGDGKDASDALSRIRRDRAEEFRALILDDPERDHNGAQD